jgi:SAM-dependent methyltransferase
MKSQANKWNQRFLESGHSLSQSRSFLHEVSYLLPSKGWGLDIAMGLGHNAAVLLKKGLNVIGVDFSKVALKSAKNEYPLIHAIMSDLPSINLRSESIDVILNFWFLDRELFPFYKKVLKPGGFLVLETMFFESSSLSGEMNPDYLIRSGELKQSFSDWDFLIYDENVPVIAHRVSKKAVRLLARKPV